jgi:hypothetical protein
MESIAHGDALRVVVFDSSTSSYRIATAATPATPITNPVGHLPYTVTFGSGRAGTLSGVTISRGAGAVPPGYSGGPGG